MGMDIAGTKKKIQRATKVAEESYKKMNEMMEKIQQLQEDLATTSTQVDHMEYDLAEQRVLLETIADQHGLDVDQLLEEADLPAEPNTTHESESASDTTEMATSRPSASEE
jgi:septal ring factor EnvC (AmiA/AmiB activator)